MSLRLAAVAVAALAAVPAAAAAITVSAGVTAPSLRVDAAGNAEVSWTAQGQRRSAVLRPTGARSTERGLVGTDISQAVRGTHVAFQRVIRSAPGGWYYALQVRRVGGRVELRFARWHGVPTEVSLTATLVPNGVRLIGGATLDGKAFPAATAARMRAQLEVKGDAGWRRLSTVTLNRSGRYDAIVPDSASRTYRVVVPGPGLAPDAAAVAHAIVLDPGR
jgi:hypothetical protein